MKNRVPKYPGRVKLAPVSGQENTYDLTRADEPIEEGTPLNKASLLSDETAAAFGLDENATVSDVLGKFVKQVIESPFAFKVAVGSYTGTGTYGSSSPCSLTFDFKPYFGIIHVEYGFSTCFSRDSSTTCGQHTAVYMGRQQVTWTDRGVSWYSDTRIYLPSGSYTSPSDAAGQLNERSATYYYTFIGM